MKLIYLADLQWAAAQGRPYTEARYYRWNHGPFSREVLQALEWMDGVEVVCTVERWSGEETHRYQSGVSTRLGRVELDPAFVHHLDEVAQQWHGKPLRELLDHVYGGNRFRGTKFGELLF